MTLDVVIHYTKLKRSHSLPYVLTVIGKKVSKIWWSQRGDGISTPHNFPECVEKPENILETVIKSDESWRNRRSMLVTPKAKPGKIPIWKAHDFKAPRTYKRMRWGICTLSPKGSSRKEPCLLYKCQRHKLKFVDS